MPKEEIPLKMVGGNHFGRYPKISCEETFNMIVSDAALVDYAGYEKREFLGYAAGRGGFASTRAGIMVCVVGGSVLTVSRSLTATWVGSLETTTGNVWMTENNANQIAISDGSGYYVYNYVDLTFERIPLDFSPGFLSFHNGRIMAAVEPNTWRLSAVDDAKSFPVPNTGSLQMKPDRIQAVLPIPGKANYAFVMGRSVTESWADIGGALFPYQRSSSFNIDFGCVNPKSIAWLEESVVWVGMNEKSGAVIFASQGGAVAKISTDGIDFRLAQLKHPDNCSGFMFKQDGHLIYQITWPLDNLSYAYDFATKEFFTVTDADLNHHIGQSVMFFNGKYYMLSYLDGWLYEFGTNFTTLDGQETPRIRICPPVRKPSQDYFRAISASFTVENGEPGDGMAIDFSMSLDGGVNYSNAVRQPMNAVGNRRSKMIFWIGGAMNDMTPMVRFNGLGRYVVFDGVVDTL